MRPRRRCSKGISVGALKRMSANDCLQLWNLLTSELLDVPPRDWIDSKGTFPSRDECAAGLVRAVEAHRRKVHVS